MGKTAPKIEEKPTTLDDALKVISMMEQAHENALLSLGGDLADAEEEISELQDAAADADELADTAVFIVVEEAARILQKLKVGRISEAIDDLDRLIAANDDDCKARTSAVAVML